jgi:glycerol-3-phosphate dehydrogenase (NAD(P)+)
MMYGNSIEQVDDIQKRHQNTRYFGADLFLSPKIKATTDLAKAVTNRRIILIAVPTNAVRPVLEQIAPLISHKVTIINTAKGFDPSTNERMSELIREVIPKENRKAVVSLIGPSHAEEVILRNLTAITATSLDIREARLVQKLFSNNYFRVYTNKDEVGAEIGVAMKNAIAIASGVLAGLGYGDNARAALITRGLTEMVRFGRAFGGQMKTYLGLTGLGDLIVTCNSLHSRNFMAGFQIGKEDTSKDFLAKNVATVEGIRAAKTIYLLAKAKQIDIPIVEAIYRVLYEDAKPSEMIARLMVRPLKAEDE